VQAVFRGRRGVRRRKYTHILLYHLRLKNAGPGGSPDGVCWDMRLLGLIAGRVRVLHAFVRGEGSYLVDPASSHMLVSKIKPCMSKYKQLYSKTANGSLNQL
jgi:hypothetical protein